MKMKKIKPILMIFLVVVIVIFFVSSVIITVVKEHKIVLHYNYEYVPDMIINDTDTTYQYQKSGYGRFHSDHILKPTIIYRTYKNGKVDTLYKFREP